MLEERRKDASSSLLAGESATAASAPGPFAPQLNSLLSQSFGTSLAGLTLSTGDDSQNQLIQAHAHTRDRHISLSSGVQQNAKDPRSMEVIAHEVAHALAGRDGKPTALVDRPGDHGEDSAYAAGKAFAHYAEGGLKGQAPSLRPAHGGKAVIHRYQVQGPYNYNKPVHETITQEALKKAGMIDPKDKYDGANAWEYTRGVMWNDDPQSMLFDSNKRGDFSSGIQYGWNFKDYEKRAAKGEQFGVGSPLLARTHFGDMSPLHGMAGKDGEKPEDTRAKMMMWAEFTSKVSMGEIKPDAKISDIHIPGFEMFAQDKTMAGKSVSDMFGVDKTGGDVKKRAMGSLLHMIEDSYAGGHSEREDLGNGHKGKIKSFHSYANQDHEKHDADDQFHGGNTPMEKLAKVPGALDALDQGSEVLKLLNKKGANWEEVHKYLDQNTFAMVDKPEAASPGTKYEKAKPAPPKAKKMSGLMGDFPAATGVESVA